MQTETHNEAINNLQEWKQKLDIAYQDLVVNGDVDKNSKPAIENRMKSEVVGNAIQTLKNERMRLQRQENIFAMILGAITVTMTVTALLVLLALYLAKYFQENNIDFEIM